MLSLSEHDRAMLEGELGAGVAMAMRVVCRTAQVMQASNLIDIASAHIDGCLYHGQASLDFVERFVQAGAKVAVPTTLNVGSLDLIHPELFQGEQALSEAAQRLMKAHIDLGCQSTFTCAPYQMKQRPKLGEQIAWAESNAIVFANSVLGARTNRYGDFLDLAAALTGRTPYAGFHIAENRAATMVFHAPAFKASERDISFAALGFWVGERTASHVPAITGLPDDTTEDELKALGAAAASSGAVALFHAVGITPEAPTLPAALQGRAPQRIEVVSEDDLRGICDRMNHGVQGEVLTAVSVGTPHFSLAEFGLLATLLDKTSTPMRSDFYVNTSRFILWQLEEAGMAHSLAQRGVRIVVDTCTYLTPIMRDISGVVMTNSAKMAHYAPANIGARMAFASLQACVRSAMEGRVCFDD